MEYVALDFETANMTSSSACALGLVLFDEEGVKMKTFYSLLRPKELIFDPECFRIHKLLPEDIVLSPTLSDLYSTIIDFIGDRILVAHNAQFDMKVLQSSLESYSLKVPKYTYYCTLSLSRKLWKGKSSYKLSSLAHEFGWYYREHNALEDAEICGRIFSKLCGSNLYNPILLDKMMNKLYKKNSNGFPRVLS